MADSAAYESARIREVIYSLETGLYFIFLLSKCQKKISEWLHINYLKKSF